MSVRHRWRVVGRDFNTTIPNIWKCERCSLFKAVLYPRIEFSTIAGEVISVGVRKHVTIPSCCE
jgi:hypothetical protein